MYTLKSLTHYFGLRKVLDVPELTLEQGLIYALLGPNGAGKTTLLEILSFIQTPTEGTVYFKERRVEWSEKYLRGLRRHVVIVPQTPILFTTTVYKNLEFALKIRKTPKDERSGIIHDALRLVGMNDFADYKAHRLSGGETQRVAIARALCCNPQVILFDEPTANVDVENQTAIENVIRKINGEQKITVVMTTHNHIQAARLADKILFLHQGRFVQSVYENIFSGEIRSNGNGKSWCVISNNVQLPIQTDISGKCRISVDPTRVYPVGEGVEVGKSVDAMNARVIQITDEGSMIRVLIDIGVPLNLQLPKKVYTESPFLVGADIMIRYAEDAVEVI